MTNTISNKTYLKGFLATTLLATGGFMLMPFGAAYSVNNLGISLDNLPMVYMITGVFSILSGPIAGSIGDKIGKYKVFVFGSTLAMIIILIYCNLDTTPLVWVIALSAVMFIGITSRMVSSQALMTAIPEPADRGTFMGINSSVMQISGGIASAVAGLIVVQTESGHLENYPLLGLVVSGSIIFTMAMMWVINRIVLEKNKNTQPQMANAR